MFEELLQRGDRFFSVVSLGAQRQDGSLRRHKGKKVETALAVRFIAAFGKSEVRGKFHRRFANERSVANVKARVIENG